MTYPNDEQLRFLAEQEAIKNTSEEGSASISYRMGARMGMATERLEALKVDRESLRLLNEVEHTQDCELAPYTISGSGEAELLRHSIDTVCTCGLDTHIIMLKTRLGIA